MRFLDEHRRRPAALADHLPWAALVAPGVVLNKDGSFLAAFRFRGPDLESSTEDELMAVRARLNNALKRMGSGWCLHMEARRRPATAYPASAFDLDVAWLLDEERRSRFDTADPAFETDFRLALTWLPPADETRRMERWLFDGLTKAGQDWTLALATFTPADPTGYGRIVRVRDEVGAIVEERDASAEQRAIGECNAGVYCATAALLRRELPRLGSANAQGEIYLTDLVAVAARQGVTALAVPADEVAGVNTREQLAALAALPPTVGDLT